jgi:hypothetical protein
VIFQGDLISYDEDAVEANDGYKKRKGLDRTQYILHKNLDPLIKQIGPLLHDDHRWTFIRFVMQRFVALEIRMGLQEHAAGGAELGMNMDFSRYFRWMWTPPNIFGGCGLHVICYYSVNSNCTSVRITKRSLIRTSTKCATIVNDHNNIANDHIMISARALKFTGYISVKI